MMDFLHNFHFLRPWVLLFFLVPLAFYRKKMSISAHLSSWENICDKNLLKFLLIDNGNAKRISVKKFFYMALLATIIAAAGPTWKKTEIPTFSIENPSLFVLSLAQDMQLKDITPSRLERAKFMISDIADSLPQGQFGLEVYSQEPYIITPLTDDISLIKSLLPQIVPDIVPDQGDRLDRALNLAVERFKSAGYTNGNIILFASDVGQRFDLALEKVKEASDLRYSVNIVDTSFTGNEKLKLLAEKGNGIYLTVKDTQLQKLIQKITETNAEKIKLSQNLRANYIDYGYYLVFIALFCMLPFFRRGLLILFFCSLSLQAEAGFLLNDNQEGLRYFNNGEYEQALEKFKDNLWRGITLYKQNKNEEALKELSKSQSDKAYYNTGVILTKMCQYEKAAEAFSEALKINPQNEDAQYNKKILDELFEKAKEDPSVLNCQNNQQQSQNNDDNQDENQKQQDEQQNQQNQEQQNSNQDEQNQSDSNDEKKQDQEQNNDNSEQNEQQQADSEQDNQQDKNNNDDNQQKNNNQDGDSSSDKQDNNEQNNKDSEKQDNPAKADNDTGDDTQTKNENGTDDNASDTQQQERDAQLMNAKQGDDDTEYDEEALAMQRRYREIPEDTGGLLREFIKKEYLKDRYNDENK